MVLKTATNFILKMIAFKNGGLLVLSSGVSAGITYYIDRLLIGTDIKNIILPILVYMFGFTFFFLFIILDFMTGVYASKYLNSLKEVPDKNVIKSFKLYRTLWKVLGVMLINAVVCCLAIFSEIIDSNYFFLFFLWSQVTIWVMGCGFEFHSIGENIQDFSGSKPEIFGFLGKIVEKFQSNIFKKVDKLIMNDDRENEENNINTNSNEQKNESADAVSKSDDTN